MKKKLILTLLTTATVASATLVAIISRKSSVNRLSAIEPNIGSIIIDVDDPLVKLTDSTEVVYKSALGNSFTFASYYVDIEDGCYKLDEQDGRLLNRTVINGISSFTFDCPKAQKINIGYKRESDSFYGVETFDLNSGLTVVSIDLYNPACFMLAPVDGEGDFYFSSLKIEYTCKTDYPTKEIKSVQYDDFHGFGINAGSFIGVEGQPLEDICFDNLTVTDRDYYTHTIADSNDIEILSISYNNSDSTVILPDFNEASISFVFEGFKYVSNEIDILGYDSYTVSANGIYLDTVDIKIQSTNDLPEGLTFSVQTRMDFYDSLDNPLYNSYSTRSSIPLSEATLDLSHVLLTQVGSYPIGITYQGLTETSFINVYDPEYNNIRDIYIDSFYTIPMGTTTSEFLTLALSHQAYASYYENDDILPHEITLTADNFILTDGMFDGPSTYVTVDIVYENFEGQIYLELELSVGNNPVTYTSETPVMFPMFSLSTSCIILYDNGVVDLNGSNVNQETLALYEISGTTLTINTYGVSFEFEIDTTNHTFAEKDLGEPLYTFDVDFSALGAPQNYPGYMYEGNIIVFDIGFTTKTTFTVDTNNSSIIYFNFMSMACQAVVDYVNLTMVVTLVQ